MGLLRALSKFNCVACGWYCAYAPYLIFADGFFRPFPGWSGTAPRRLLTFHLRMKYVNGARMMPKCCQPQKRSADGHLTSFPMLFAAFFFFLKVVRTLMSAIDKQSLPHLLFYGPPGTGKTSTALALSMALYGPTLYRTRTLELNASDERGISVVREKVMGCLLINLSIARHARSMC